MVQSAGVKNPEQMMRLYSRRGRHLPEPRIGDPQKSADLISFIYGFPDGASLPGATVAEATAEAMRQHGEWALQYGKTTGAPPLVNVLLAKLNRDQNITAKSENLIVTAGGSQGVQLLLDLLVDWGDTIIVEAPTWMGFLYAASNMGANIVSVPLDDEGTDVVALEHELARLKQVGITPKMIYIISNFQNPSGITTSLARRNKIVELAQEYETLILEDDAYHDLRYSGKKLPAIYELDTSGSTIYLGTLSKIMGAGMRLGWLVAPPELITKLSSLKVDGGTNIFASYVAAQWIPGNLDRHIDELKSIYRQRRDIMLDALEKQMPAGSTWTNPEGGFFVWVTLPDGVDTTKMLPQARERGMEYLPGATCYADGSGKNQMRLSFSFATEDKIEEGIRILGEIIRGELQESGVRR